MISFETRDGFLTSVLSFPLNTVEYIPLTPVKDYSKVFAYAIVIWLLIANILLPLVALSTWWYKGRDPDSVVQTARMFDPPKDKNGKKLTPMEVGTLVDEVIHSRDISAELIHLAVKKYVLIHEHKSKLLISKMCKPLFIHA